MPRPFAPPTRRQVIGVTAGALAGIGLAGTAHAATAAAHTTASPSRTTNDAPHDAPAAFDEVFQGRRIQGLPGAGHHAHHGGGYTVRVDGDELHVMRNADGTWISVVNHYEPSPTPLALARAAVLELQGADLVPLT
ncbi:tyrosinase cofactor [Streptomyces sp. NBC_00083]|uniref:apotyrosinase chaperone MelC1 n=1 Tax=Streptomyces sp. NBC_00083 TaxID=2975647 RepID=UPI0022583230|nr:tyrosinase cofactor [Streptomyces sp. NBC_00083]MCX5384025.1 tyrosinase cofactor [Streptomyces sp. NBC_00083]